MNVVACPPDHIDAPPRTLGHVVSLDGLRGLAIAAVIVFHFPSLRMAPGGYFGVDIFFALSGFLITALLLQERAKRGKVDMLGFLRRRGGRLLPALLAFLGVYVFVAALFGHTTWFASDPFGSRVGAPVPLHVALRGALTSATYILNIARARRWILPPIAHLWSLSVEGQFYLVWPITLLALTRRSAAKSLRPGGRLAIAVTTGLVVVSVLLPFHMWRGGLGADAIYFGSFTRVGGLLIGSIGAQLWMRGAFDGVPARVRSALAAVAMVGLTAMVLWVGEGRFKYLGASSVAALGGTVLAVHCALGSGRLLGRLLSNPVLVWLGQRSYALYLWHYVFDTWTNQMPHAVGIPIALVASLVTTELSWRLVEVPARRWIVGSPKPKPAVPLPPREFEPARVLVG